MTADRVNLPLNANYCERGANLLQRLKPAEWLMVNGRKDGCLGAVFAAMLLPAGVVYGIWSLF